MSTIKNLSTSVEGDFTYLRINFFLPGVAVNKAGAGSTASTSAAAAGNGATAETIGNPDMVYMKEITYRATNIKEPGEISAPSTNLNLAFKFIKDMQK